MARALWLVLWLSLAYFALLPGNRAPQALHDMIAGMTDGEPGWLGALDRGAASLLANQGLTASIVLAIALVIVAAGVYLPARYAKATLVLAIVIAAVIWVFGEAFGDHPHRRRHRPQLRARCSPCWLSPTGRLGPPSRRSPALPRLHRRGRR